MASLAFLRRRSVKADVRRAQIDLDRVRQNLIAGAEVGETISEEDAFDWLVALGVEPAEDGISWLATDRALRHLGPGELLHVE